ncbi:MAG: hypothetical protein HDS68_08735 [Bacteroidales bacterium]|nr:hypothetical protein [Bacteroidales bacterium]
MKKQIIATLLCSVAVLPHSHGAESVLCGSVYNTADASFTPGVYELPLTTAESFKLVGATDDRKATGGGLLANDIYYVGVLNNSASYWGEISLYPFNPQDWTPMLSYGISVSPAACGMVSGYTVSPADGTIYGCATDYDRASYFLYRYERDDTEFDETKIGMLTTHVGGMAANAEGTLYAFDTNGALYSISSADASMTKVGDTGFTPLVDGEFVPFIHVASIIDTKSGTMYTAVQTTDKTCSLYTVDTATAQATKIADYPEGYVVTGLYMSEGAAEPGAPAAPYDLEASFAASSLTGKISFTAPTVTYGGSELSGNLDFIIEAAGSVVASGKVYAGINRSVDVTVPAPGVYEFKVILSNAAGESPAAKIKLAVGYAAPAVPEVTAVREYSMAHITWDAVSTTPEGSPLSAAVTYRVVRHPDGKVLEESTSTTSVWDYNLGSELIAYRYGVTAICNDTPSEEGLSGAVVAGSASLPYKMTFDDAADMDYFTIIDSNNDGCTWDFYYGEVRSQANDERDGDDWLISPPMAMLAGKYYMVSLDARVYNHDLPGKFEIFLGDSPTPEAMTSQVIEPSEVRAEALTTFRGLAAPEGYGDKYIGIHSITEAGNWWLFTTNFTVSEPYESTSPSAPTNFTAISSSGGDTKVTLTLTAPLTDLGGNTLTTLESLDVYRDGTLIHTTANPTPGQTITFIDEEAGEGNHVYTADATNWSGKGVETVATGYAGINLPAGVTEAVAYSTEVPGEVIVEWKPVTTFIDGTPMDPSLVTYCIYTNVTGSDMKILDQLTGTSAKFQIMYPTEEQPQMFMQFGVTSETAGGENTKGVLTEYVALGDPYPLPYEDSFPNLQTEYLSIMGGSDRYAYWDNASDNTFEEVQSQDDDNGMLAMFSEYRGSWAYFRTGIIDLADATNPTLTFYVFNYSLPDLPNNNTIEVQIGRYARFESVKTVTLNDFGTEGWHRIEVPLNDYAGEQIQVNIIGTVDQFQWMHIDNLKVMDRNDHDMTLLSVEAPQRVKAGNCANISVELANTGLAEADEITLQLFREGEMIDSKTFTAIPSDLHFSHTFQQLHSVATPESVEYQVEVSYAADTHLDDNESVPMDVITIYPNYPTVADLTAAYTADDDKTITLTWSTPDLNGDYADDITEGFENALAWRSDVNGWTMIDADGKCIYGFNFFALPAYGPQPSSQQSWFVFDDTYEPMVSHFSDPGYYRAYNGNRYLGSMAVTNGEPDYIEERVDDWAISPELYGGSQTISFWAKSMLTDCFETVEVLYSTTGTDVTDFTSVAKFEKIPWTWTQYFVTLPAGARHFAIRNISRDQYVAMIDDVNFTPAASVDDLEISGYNIYRDGTRLNDAPVTDTHFVDTFDVAETPVYTVTALYSNRGESAFSNPASPELSGIDDTAMQSVRIFASTDCINILGADNMDITVYSIDGRTVATNRGTGHDAISVVPGTYIVKVGTRVDKLTVR